MELVLRDPETGEYMSVDAGLLRVLGFQPIAVAELYRDMLTRATEIGRYLRFYMPKDMQAELDTMEAVSLELDNDLSADGAEAD